MKRYCSKCGSSVKEESKFCGNCRSPIDNTNEYTSVKNPNFNMQDYYKNYDTNNNAVNQDGKHNQVSANPAVVNQPQLKWYNKSWVIILFLIFLFPVGLVFLWLKPEWSKAVKIVVTVVLAVLVVVGLASNGSNSVKESYTLSYNSEQQSEKEAESKQINSISDCTTKTELETYLKENYYNQHLDKAISDLESAGYTIKCTDYKGKEIDKSIIEPSLYLLDSASSINVTNKTITLKFKDEMQDAQNAREEQLQSKLDISSATTAVEMYGEKMGYIDFKLNQFTGKIAEYAEDDDTWFMKYTCEYKNIYGTTIKNNVCEARITGTTENPTVVSFVVY